MIASEAKEIIVVLGALAIALCGIRLVFQRLESKQQGFGPNSIKALGFVVFMPCLLILATVVNFQTETLAALLGAVAGYILSNSQDKNE